MSVLLAAILAYACFALVLAGAVAVRAGQRGRSPRRFYLLSVLLSPLVGWALVRLLPSRQVSQQVQLTPRREGLAVLAATFGLAASGFFAAYAVSAAIS